MSKTTFLGYVPSLKAKHEATIVGCKAIESKGGSIRYMLQGEYDGRKTLPKTVSKADFESVYGFDAKEAESVIIHGTKDGKKAKPIAHKISVEEKDGFVPNRINIPSQLNPPYTVETSSLKTGDFENHAETVVGNPSPASVEPPAPSEKPFPQEPSNENFSAEYTEDDICFVCSNPDTENEVTYCESDADCGKAICDDCRYEDIGRLNWVKLDEDPEDDNSAMADVCRECADNNEPVLFEAFGLFGDKDEEKEEEKEPETQEFTVIMQPGDKLELTDIPDEDEEKDDSDDDKSEDEDADEENVEKEAVQTKLTRPVKEEDEDEEDESDEGMSTLAKVGLGVGALAVGAAILGAEDEGEDDYWNGENAEWRAEGSGSIEHDSIDTIEDAEVHFRHDYPTTDYEWTTSKDDLTDEEEDMVDSEVSWDIGSEPSEGDESASIDVDGVGTVDYTKDTDYGDKRFYGLAAEGEDADSTVVWELIQQNLNNPHLVRHYCTVIFGHDPNLASLSRVEMADAVAEAVQQNWRNQAFINHLSKELGFEIQEAEDFQKMTPSEFVPFDQMQEELGQMWDETTAPLADAHNYDYNPSNEPTNANFSADTYIDLSPFKQRIANGASAKNVIETYRIHGKEDRKELMDYESRLYETETVGSPSPSGPSSVPEPAEATGSEPSNENMVKAADTKMAIGLTVAGVGLAVLLGKDRLAKWMDRFNL